MNREARNFRKVVFNAVFQPRGQVMDFSDGEAAVHGAVARDEHFMEHRASANFVAIDKLPVLRLERV